MKKLISVCYVDDDQDEIQRFRDCLQHRYVIGAGLTLSDALKELNSQNVHRPDVVLLDLYYGPLIADPAKRKAIIDADEELSKMERKVQQLLDDAQQSPDEGFELAGVVTKTLSRVPLAFFSRKAFLKDALRAQEAGLPVLEKPDPLDSDLNEPDPYKIALQRNMNQIASRIDNMVYLNNWWVRNGEWIRGFAMGLFFFLAAFAWEIWKIEASLEKRLALELGLVVIMLPTLALAWFKHS